MRPRLICLLALVLIFSQAAPAQTFVPVEFKSSDLPIVLIDTHGVPIFDAFEIEADMGIVYNGVGMRNDTANVFNNYNGKITIEIRGSSSQMFPKKQYKIELRTDDGQGDSAVSLLGLPEESDWILFAPYNDKTLMRDVLAHKLGRDMGHYSPRTRYCEVVMKVTDESNTPHYVYQGVYVLIEKIKRDKNRVDIAKLNPDENTGDDVTGGYIIKIDKTTGDSGAGWFSLHKPDNGGEAAIYYQYEYPKWDEVSAPQKTYIQGAVKKFEDVLAGRYFTDPVNGYAKYIDVNSFIDFMIMQEITRNVDGYRLSTFLYKQKDSDGGKFVMGPFWDFNLGFGNSNYCSGSSLHGWMYSAFNQECAEHGALVPFWWRRLMEDVSFKRKFAQRWAELRDGILSTSSINQDIDSIYNVLNTESAGRNFIAWPVLGQWVWPNDFVGATFQQEVNYLKGWIEDRMIWIDANVQTVTATEPTTFSFQFNFGKNPVENEIKFDYTTKVPGKMEITLVDVTGRAVKNIAQTHTGVGKFEQVVHRSDLQSGLHIVKVSFNGETLVSKLVVR